MKDYSKKIAYLRGLADGLDIKNDTKESKLLKGIVEAMEELANGIEGVEGSQKKASEQLDILEERVCDVENDLTDLEDEFYDFQEDMEDDFWDDEDGDADEEYAFQCPKCGKAIYLDSSVLDSDEDTVVCPNCNERIKLEFDCDCGVDCDYDDDDEDSDDE